MRIFLVSIAVWVLLTPAYGDIMNCFFGWTQDEDEDPGSDWSDPCLSKVDDNACQGASCAGDKAVCYKVRFEGDDGILSLYGCVDNYDEPSNNGSWVPAGYTVNDLQLRSLKEEDDTCDEEGDATVPALQDGMEALGGDSATALRCTCIDDACNAAVGNAVSLFALVGAAVWALV